MTDPSPEMLHASCVAIGGRAVLLAGRSGVGKSDLAMRLIDRGAVLVSDDYTRLIRQDGGLRASPPATIAGGIEVRGVGIVAMPYVADVPVALLIDLEAAVTRMPEPATRRLAGVDVPIAALEALEASAPLKVELLLRGVA